MDFLYESSLPKLYGVTRDEFDDIARESYAKYLKKKLYPGALREIEELRTRGVRVVLATSTPFEAVYPLALDCGFSAADVVSTQFSYTDGVFDGKLIGVPVFSRYKGSIIRDYVERSGIDLQHCSFYSDSVHDLPLLELVGTPRRGEPGYQTSPHRAKARMDDKGLFKMKRILSVAAVLAAFLSCQAEKAASPAPSAAVFTAPASIPADLVSRINADKKLFIAELDAVLASDSDGLLVLVDKKHSARFRLRSRRPRAGEGGPLVRRFA